MKIIVANSAGFCFGVKRAVETVEAFLREKNGWQIATLGNLIHNPQMTESFARSGVETIEPEQVAVFAANATAEHPAVLILRAHGVEKQTEETIRQIAAQNPWFSYVDCTCPYVKAIHKRVAENTDADTHLIILGDASHPEVRGICSYASGKVTVCKDMEELSHVHFCEKRIVMVAQTTQKLSEWRKCQEFLKNLFTNSKIFDTICSITEQRQQETEALAKKVDRMIVIGGRNSSNTRKLYEIARATQPDTLFIERASELPSGVWEPRMCVGVTAGASTPSGTIEEVKNKMSELQKNTEIRGEENFEELYGQDPGVMLHIGDIVVGKIASVSDSEIRVTLAGAPVDGVIPATEVSGSGKLTDQFHVGDEIEAKVIKYSDAFGEATLSKKSVDDNKNWKFIEEAKEKETVIEAPVTKAVKGGVLMEYLGTELFVPASLCGLPKDADLATLVGTTQKAKIIEIDQRKHRAVASIKVVQREERKAQQAAFWDTVEEGKQYTGKVKSLTSFGAFVDLGGIDGMIHVSELSWKRIKHPSEVVNVGDTVTVFIKSFDKEAKRISLGYKTEESNPWTIFRNQYKVGDVVPVKIVSLTTFGAFAEIVPGTDGLIHLSQLSDHRVADASEVLKVGDVVDAKIIDVDEANHRISLSIRQVLEDAKAAEAPAEAEETKADEA